MKKTSFYVMCYTDEGDATIKQVNGWTDGEFNYLSYDGGNFGKLWRVYDKSCGLYIKDMYSSRKQAYEAMQDLDIKMKLYEVYQKPYYKDRCMRYNELICKQLIEDVK